MKVSATMLLAGVTAAFAGCSGETGQLSARSGNDAYAATPLPGIVARRLWVGSDINFYAASISASGQSFTTVDWETGDLAVRAVQTDELRRITAKGDWSDSEDFAEVSAFSRDGRQIAYAWSNATTGGYELRIINTDGSAARVLYSNGANVVYITPEEWSRDGKTILATIYRPDRTREITLVSVENGTRKVLKTLDWRSTTQLSFSPDGRYVAYDFPPEEKTPQRDIFAIAVDGSHETRVVSGPNNEQLLGWSDRNGGILFYSDRDRTPGIWLQPMRHAQPDGAPVLVRGEVWRLSSLGFARGSYYYGQTVNQPQMHSATVDLTTGRMLSDPNPISPVGDVRTADWSHNGRWLAYFYFHSAERRPRLALRGVGGQEHREQALDFENVRRVRWGTDENTLLIQGSPGRGRGGIYLLDLRSGTTKPIIIRPEIGEFDLSPDGATLYVRHYVDAVSTVLIACETTTGRQRTVWTFPSGGGMAVSPDGQSVAYSVHERPMKRHRVFIRALGGDAERMIYEVAAPRMIPERGSVSWTPDGKFLLIDETRPGGLHTLMVVPADGGAARSLFEFDGITFARLHPDGRQLLFHGGKPRGEVWALDNLPVADDDAVNFRP